ncbi:MAG: glycosyltransferase family 4 protein [Chlorobi bacterium]|nr:glycosyltransferase family 4 protein [Chlorobiota bacterium]
MKKILYVHHGKGIGGAPLSLLYTIRGLDRSRFEPMVLCIYDSEAVDLFRREGITTFVSKGIHDFSHTNVLWYRWWQAPKILFKALMIPVSYWKAKRFLRLHPVDIVHLNTSTLFAFAAAASKTTKVVWHVREPLARGYLGVRKAIVRRCIHRYADAVIPICRYDAEQLIPSPKIRVVYNFIDFSVFDRNMDGDSVRARYEIGPTEKVVLMLGGVNPIKGTKEFVRAAERILAEYSDYWFLVAGEVPEKSMRAILSGKWKYAREVNRIVEGIPRRERIVFTGNVSRVVPYIAAADLVCFPSTVPHFARPIIEAAAMARPVVASDLGGPRELVVPGKTGLLVEPGNPDALAEAITAILEKPEVASAMGEEGCRFAREHFDAAKNIQLIMDIYARLE